MLVEEPKEVNPSADSSAVKLICLLACPHCNGESGYYEKWVQKYSDYFGFSGTHIEGGEFTSAWGGKRKYCSDCDRDITKYIKAKKTENDKLVSLPVQAID